MALLSNIEVLGGWEAEHVVPVERETAIGSSASIPLSILLAHANTEDTPVILAKLLKATRMALELLPKASATVAVDLLQNEIDADVDMWSNRPLYIKCLRKLVRLHDILPTSFFCHSVIRTKDVPEYGGGFSDVYRGELNGKCVAVKVLRFFTDQSDREVVLTACRKEAFLWHQLRHENVLPFFGINEDLAHPSVCLISPWMKNGNVMFFLRSHPDSDRLEFIRDIANGLNYLHSQSPPIVHADIRGANIMVTDDLHCCIGDFGISILAESTFSEQHTSAPSAEHRGTLRWLPPEAMEATPDYAPSRDIYSLGCTIIEIFTGKVPYAHIRTDHGVMREIIAGRLLQVPEDMPTEPLWTKTVPQCLSQHAFLRPSAQEVVDALQASWFEESPHHYFATALSTLANQPPLGNDTTVGTAHTIYKDKANHQSPNIFDTTPAEQYNPLSNIPSEGESWLELANISGAKNFLKARLDQVQAEQSLASEVLFPPDSRPRGGIQCSQCSTGAVYKDERSLKVHTENEHRRQTYSCVLGCGKEFRHAASASRHRYKCVKNAGFQPASSK